jgi:glycerate dehydrogenase
LTHGIFLDRDSIDRGDLDVDPLIGTLPQWTVLDTAQAREGTAAHIRGADVVVSNKVVLDADTLAQATQLRLVCVAATGTNNVDLEAAAAQGVAVTNVRGYATPAVAQHVFALILALTTRLVDYREAVLAGRWHAADTFCLLDFPIRELAGLTLGIVGYGDLGRGVARIGEAFGMETAVAQRPGGEPRPGRVPLDELVERADVLSLHCPLTPETRGLIGARELARMKPDAVLINTARGGLVDEQALADALRAGRLGGAGVDVIAEEPPRRGSPLLEPGIPNLIVTPHTAWATRQARQRVIDEVAANIRAFVRGEKRNRVC